MKWMLIMIVFGVGPVKTDLLFDSLEDCLNAGDRAAGQHIEAYNRRVTSFRTTGREELEQLAGNELLRIPKNTCIPHAG